MHPRCRDIDEGAPHRARVGHERLVQMPLAAAICHTMKKTIRDSTGSAARVSPPRHLFVDATVVGESACDSSGAISTNTDTVRLSVAETKRRMIQRQQESSERAVVTPVLVPAGKYLVEI